MAWKNPWKSSGFIPYTHSDHWILFFVFLFEIGKNRSFPESSIIVRIKNGSKFVAWLTIEKERFCLFILCPAKSISWSLKWVGAKIAWLSGIFSIHSTVVILFRHRIGLERTILSTEALIFFLSFSIKVCFRIFIWVTTSPLSVEYFIILNIKSNYIHIIAYNNEKCKRK